MTHTRIEIEKYAVEVCDNCGHDVSHHYDAPRDVFDDDGKYMYTAEGCMVLAGTRKLKGENPYLRCDCLKSA